MARTLTTTAFFICLNLINSEFRTDVSFWKQTDRTTEDGRCVDEEIIGHLFTLEAVVPHSTSFLLEKAFKVRECFMIMLRMAFFSIIGVWTVGAGEFRAAHVKARRI